MKAIVLSLLLALNVFAGGDPKNEVIVRHQNEYVLAFNIPNTTDTIFVGIRTAAIKDSIVGVKICVLYPKRITAKDVVVKFNYTDGTTDMLYQLGYPDKNNYVEYFFANGTKYVSNKKVKQIMFGDTFVFDVKSKSYFKSFIKSTKS